MKDEILVIAELSDGRILPVTHELIAFAQAMALHDSAEVRVVVPGRMVQTAARDLANETAVRVLAMEGDALEPYNAEAWVAALAPWLATRKPRYVCIPHTSRGCDFAPGLAVRLNAACITAIEDFRRKDNVLCFIRSVFNGKIRMHVTPKTDVAVLCVLSGIFKAATRYQERSDSSIPPVMKQDEFSRDSCGAHVETLEIPYRSQKIRALGVAPAAVQDFDLTLADVIVSAGRGIGFPENLELIRCLASLFSKSTVGCSRAVCDLGWLGHKHQVGLTGRTVAPRLYIACGISGAVQHISGMRNSGFIIAINTDPRAAIFQVTDVGIVEDLTTFIPLVMKKAICLNSQ